MAKFCGSCGAEGSSSMKFCRKCGAPVQQEENDQTQSIRKISPESVQPTLKPIKKSIEKPMQKAIQQTEQQPYVKSVKRAKSNNNPWKIVAVVALVIMAAILLVFKLVGSGDEANVDLTKVIEVNELYGEYAAVVDIDLNEFVEQLNIPEKDLLALETSNAGRVMIDEDQILFEYIDVELGGFVPAGLVEDYDFDRGILSGNDVGGDTVNVEVIGNFTRDLYNGEEQLLLNAQLEVVFLLADGNEAVLVFTFIGKKVEASDKDL